MNELTQKRINLSNQIHMLREQGLSYRLIASKVNCSVGTVNNYLTDNVNLKERTPIPKKKYPTKMDMKSRESRKDRMLRHRYGITFDEFILMYNNQNGNCMICEKPKSHLGRKGIQVDHCHTTGVVRGLLCPSCNTAIGRFENDIPLFTKVVSYLNETH
jgi:hypothetical protein